MSLSVTLGQLSDIKQKVRAKLERELSIAFDNDTVDEFLERYGIVLEDDYTPVNTRTMKILVFGAVVGNIKDYQMVLKKLGVDPDNVVFISDYGRLKHFDTARLEYSQEYSDIIFGPNPHMQVNIDGYNSFLSKIRENPAMYPRLTVATDSHGLKLSISAFKECIQKTRYFENLIYE